MTAQKVSTEILTTMKALQTRYDDLIRVYGELNLRKRILEAELQQVEDQFNDLEGERQQVSDQVMQQFGKVGTVNLETGEFLPG